MENEWENILDRKNLVSMTFITEGDEVVGYQTFRTESGEEYDVDLDLKSKRKNNSMERELEMKDKQIDELGSQLAANKIFMELQEANYKRAMAEVKELKSQLAEKEQRIEILGNTIIKKNRFIDNQEVNRQREEMQQKEAIDSLKSELAEKEQFIKNMEVELAQVADESVEATHSLFDKMTAMYDEIEKLKIRAREADEAEKAAQPLLAKVVSLTSQLTTAEYQIRIRDAQIEDLQKAAASPIFEDSDGLPMDVDEMAYRLNICEKRLDDKNAEIIRLKAQLYDYQKPHDD